LAALVAKDVSLGQRAVVSVVRRSGRPGRQWKASGDCFLGTRAALSPKIYAMDCPDKLRIKLPMPEGADRFNAARGLLAALAPG
ncbi:hypothetical protein, partial [Xanthomonas phaseoli]|uniref:hypothetical protein n=1 Tax=Xanthomonas phaseoli TaxID=1985254 RepID=UPI001E40D6B9